VPWWRWGGWSWGAGKWWKFSGYHPDYFRIDLEYLEWRCTWDIYRVYIYKYNYIYIYVYSRGQQKVICLVGCWFLNFHPLGWLSFRRLRLRGHWFLLCSFVSGWWFGTCFFPLILGIIIIYPLVN
jgi:hypothetical protein